MASVAIFHASIGAGGGAESVAVHTIDTLAREGHDVTVYTADEATQCTLEDQHGISIPDSVSVRRPAPFVRGAIDLAINAVAEATHVTDLPLLRRAILERRIAPALGRQHDLVVSTDGPFAVPGPAIEYVHFPYYVPAAMRQYESRFDETLFPAYHKVCRTLRPATDPDCHVTLTNSEWTANVIEETTGRRATVVAPPVGVDDFDPPAWDRMENGILCIGRIHPLKRQHIAIAIVDALRERNVDTHLHIVGGPGSEEYDAQIRAQAEKRTHVHYEGRVSRERLVDLIERHRFGLHARPYEHFGIAVAEMMAGKSIPFVPTGGGQTELVNNREELVFDSVSEATEKMTTVIASPEEYQVLAATMRDEARQYSSGRFSSEIVEHVESALCRDNRVV